MQIKTDDKTNLTVVTNFLNRTHYKFNVLVQAFYQVQILADDVVLKVGNLAFSGAQLVAKTVKAIIDRTMTLESLQSEVISSEKQRAWGTHLNALGAGIGGTLQGPATSFSGFLYRMNHTPLGMIPTIRQEDQRHVEKILHEMAQFVGTEEFTLKVGQSLINRSAEVGLRVDGVVKDSGVDAKRVLNQPLQDVHIHKRDAIVVPLADTLALFGALNELTVLRRQAFDAMKEQGLSDQEAVKVLKDPVVQKQLTTMAERKEKLLNKALEIREKADAAEQLLEPAEPSLDPLAGPDQKSLQMQIILQQEEREEQQLKELALQEARQEILEIDALLAADPSPQNQAKVDMLHSVVLEKFNAVARTLGTYTIPFYDLYVDIVDNWQHDKPLTKRSVIQKLRNGTLDLGLMIFLPGIKWVGKGTQAVAKTTTEIVGKSANKNIGQPRILRNHRLGKNFEAHLGKMFEGMEIETQVPFKNGARVKPGTKGSSVPDLLLNLGDKKIAIEAKRPVVPTTRNLLRMADRTGKQVLKASKNLPKEIKQRVYTDIEHREFQVIHRNSSKKQ